MFKIVADPTFVAAVPLSRPGLSAPIVVQVTYRYKNRDELRAWIARSGTVDDVQYLDEVIESWTGVQDEKGEVVPYSVTALSDILARFTPSRGEFFRTYLSELTDSKRKNS